MKGRGVFLLSASKVFINYSSIDSIRLQRENHSSLNLFPFVFLNNDFILIPIFEELGGRKWG